MGKRFFVKTENQSLAKDFFLVDSEHHHLANVMRLRVGDELVIVCGDEFDYFYKIVSITKNSTGLEFVKRVVNQCNPKEKLTVYISLIKFDNLVTAITKLSEIGVSDVVLFNSDYSNIATKSVNILKLEKILEQSCKQCERSIPIKLRGVMSFAEMLKDLPGNVVFADETKRDEKLSFAGVDAVVIGPEGGFSGQERDALGIVAKPISLGRRVLRTETAAIVASTLILSKKGEI